MNINEKIEQAEKLLTELKAELQAQPEAEQEWPQKHRRVKMGNKLYVRPKSTLAKAIAECRRTGKPVKLKVPSSELKSSQWINHK